jgi:hypothetical protein
MSVFMNRRQRADFDSAVKFPAAMLIELYRYRHDFFHISVHRRPACFEFMLDVLRPAFY